LLHYLSIGLTGGQKKLSSPTNQTITFCASDWVLAAQKCSFIYSHPTSCTT